MLKSKIHEATVTGTDVYCEGSIAIDEDLMDKVDLLPYEKVLVADCNNYNRFETYVVPAERGSGKIEVLGATAPLTERGHQVNILAFSNYDTKHEVCDCRIIALDKENKIKDEKRYSL